MANRVAIGGLNRPNNDRASLRESSRPTVRRRRVAQLIVNFEEVAKLRHLGLGPHVQLALRRLTWFDRTYQHAAATVVVIALIANLPELAVAQDVEADLALAANHVLNRRLRQF